LTAPASGSQHPRGRWLVPIEAVTLAHIEAIFEVTDRLGIHRESLVIPLGTRVPGSVSRTKNGKLQIIVDRDQPFGDFVRSLEERIRALP
jgi:hypothetical protein